MIKTCGSCGAKALVTDVRDVPYSYKGHATFIKDVQGEFCGACDESMTGPEESARMMTAMRAFKQEVNASLADAGFIRETRAKLGLTQQAASRLFGGGNNGFSRYESGETKPTLALVQLFRLLDRRPELLSEIIDNSDQKLAISDLVAPQTMGELVQNAS
jgi:HTH-type transcriptional regulator / antitoxin MqsA